MQGHVYHWRHGWIPLSHFAALQKAHGSHKGAAKYLNESNGPHGSASHTLAKSVSPEHNLGALEVRKSSKSGFDVVHTPSGMHMTNHSTKAHAEAARQDYAKNSHDLHVSGESLRGNKDAMEHLQSTAREHMSAETERKREASLVVAARRQRPAGSKVNNPSKPGDLVVVSNVSHTWVNGSGRQDTEQHTPGIVTHVHSDGTPIAYRNASGSFSTVGPRDTVRVMPASEIDTHGLLRHVRDTNRWGSSEHTKPHYDSIGALTDVAKRFRRKPAA